MHGVECRDAAVAARQFCGDHSFGQWGEPGATVPDDRATSDPQPGISLDQLGRELGPLPEPRGRRGYFGVTPATDLITQLPLIVSQQLVQLVKIGSPGRGKVVADR